MASGKLGSAALAADTYTTVYTVPAGKAATINIALVNRGADTALVRVALTNEAVTPLDEDFIEYDAKLPIDGGILERTAVVASAGEKIMVMASTASVTVRVHGFEEDA
ncbi:hypothetical protein [Thiomicrorhabdus cannonii]|uniref:hypothetical protein n=1 Tax=Thiomicrorhabdus cannonii TaxID=2748011 RepID=UPI0015BE9CA8|nr:hypothetical protein [Thiomicrorhabdus cannonii]